MKLLTVGCFFSISLCAVTRTSLSAFDQGKRFYESGQYNRALDLFSQSISQSSDASQRNKSYYFQGLVLFELGHLYSSFTSFKNVLISADNKSPELYDKAIKNSVLISDRLNMVERIGKVLANFPAQLVPSSANGHYRYAMGAYSFNQGNFEEAAGYLKSVNPENPFYFKALFYLGVLATKRKNYKDSIFYFEKVIQLTAGKKDFFSQNELARLNLARSLYSSGEIEKSVEVYSQFVSSSSHWLTILLEASWPLLRVNDTTISLGNLHTVLSPFYREEMVGEAYILRATILFSLCKYEEMRRTISQFFTIYDPILRSMQQQQGQGPEAFYRGFTSAKGIHSAFINFAKRDSGLQNSIKIISFLENERAQIAKFSQIDQMRRMGALLEDAIRSEQMEMGKVLQGLHKRKLQELVEQREQANYLKVEIVTGEKDLIEGQKGLPPKRLVEVETTVSKGYHFWPYEGEYWEDELGTYVYTTESACIR